MTDSDDNDTVSSRPAQNETRRKLVRKLAVGAFAVPAVLAALSRTPAHAS